MAQSPPRPIRVIVVDDHPMVREGTAAYLRSLDDIDVVGEAGDARSCLQLVRDLEPDVLLLDLRLPDGHGVQVARQVRKEQPGVALLVMTGYDYVAYRRELDRMGIGRILGKSATGAEIAEAVREAASGNPLPVAGSLETARIPLSKRESQVLEMLAAGLRNADIAARLAVSVKTVEFHVNNLLTKIGARSRMDAVLKAQDLRIMSPRLLPPNENHPSDDRSGTGPGS